MRIVLIFYDRYHVLVFFFFFVFEYEYWCFVFVAIVVESGTDTKFGYTSCLNYVC